MMQLQYEISARGVEQLHFLMDNLRQTEDHLRQSAGILLNTIQYLSEEYHIRNLEDLSGQVEHAARISTESVSELTDSANTLASIIQQIIRFQEKLAQRTDDQNAKQSECLLSQRDLPAE